MSARRNCKVLAVLAVRPLLTEAEIARAIGVDLLGVRRSLAALVAGGQVETALGKTERPERQLYRLRLGHQSSRSQGRRRAEQADKVIAVLLAHPGSLASDIAALSGLGKFIVSATLTGLRQRGLACSVPAMTSAGLLAGLSFWAFVGQMPAALPTVERRLTGGLEADVTACDLTPQELDSPEDLGMAPSLKIEVGITPEDIRWMGFYRLSKEARRELKNRGMQARG